MEQAPKKICDLLLKHSRYLTEEMKIRENVSIAIKDGKIMEIVQGDSGYAGGEVVDGSHLLWMPGLTDGHLHTTQQLLRGKLLDERPVIWKRINVPFESQLSREDVKFSALLASLEMILGGTTSFLDAGGIHMEEAAGVFAKAGLRGGVSSMTGDSEGLPENLRIGPEEAVRRFEELQQAVCSLGEGRLHACLSLTSPMSCSPELMDTVFSASMSGKIPLVMHMNEYSQEVFNFQEKYECRPVEFLERQRLLSEYVVLAHCIFLSGNEIQSLAERHVKVVHCPFSNCGKGVPDTPRLLEQGIDVSFGTDGTAHGGLDLFSEMKIFRSVMNAVFGAKTCDAGIMTAEEILSIAVRGGAKAMMAPNLGAIQEGFKADLIAVNLDQPHLFPTHNLVHTLVESVRGSDVWHMVVDGRLIMKDREILTLDKERIRCV